MVQRPYQLISLTQRYVACALDCFVEQDVDQPQAGLTLQVVPFIEANVSGYSFQTQPALQLTSCHLEDKGASPEVALFIFL